MVNVETPATRRVAEHPVMVETAGFLWLRESITDRSSLPYKTKLGFMDIQKNCS
jgi:hypothetical protein